MPHAQSFSLHIELTWADLRLTQRHSKAMLTFAECLDEAHEVGRLAGPQDLAQGPDVVLCEAESLDLWQFLGFRVTGDDFP